MKQIISKSSFLITLVAVFALVFSSCSTSESVVNNGFLQKRKYNKGFHKSIKKNNKTQDVKNEEVLVFNNETNVEKTERVSIEKETLEVEKTTPVAIENNSIEEVAEVTVQENTISTEEAPVKEHKAVEKLAQKVAKVKSKVNKDSIINNSSNTSNTTDDMMILLIILAILLPFVAVGIYTDWDVTKVLIALLLSLLFWLPGIIYALLVINDMA